MAQEIGRTKSPAKPGSQQEEGDNVFMQTITNNYNTISEIKPQVNILDIVTEVVPLTRKGARYLGLCPFHNEKTPSFTVNPAKQRFHCFGCGASGDVFDFVQLFYSLTFKEARSWLAQRYGISRDVTPAARMEAKKAIHQRQVDRQREVFAQGIIKREYDRLCILERQIYRIIAGIHSEADLDRPEVIASLQNQAYLENFLDRWLDKDTDDPTRYEMALLARGVF